MRLLNEKIGAELIIDGEKITPDGCEFTIKIGSESLTAQMVYGIKERNRDEVNFRILNGNQGFLSSKDHDFINESGFYRTLRDIVTVSYLMKNRKRKALNEMSSFLMMSKIKAENFYNTFKKNNPEKCPRIYEGIKNHNNWCYINGNVNRLVPISELYGFGSLITSIVFDKTMYSNDHFTQLNY